MSIIGKALIEQTRNERALRTKPSFRVDVDATGDVSPHGFATQSEYAMTIKVWTTFWANKAQYQDALRVAERTILHAMYGDTIAKLDAAVHALYAYETEEALALLDLIRSDLVK